MKASSQLLQDVLLGVDEAQVLPFDLNRERLVIFDFSRENPDLHNIDVSDTPAFNRYVFQKLEQKNVRVGIGKYDENRTIYDKSAIFGSSGESLDQRRTLHIGLDLWVVAGTPVLAPLDGRVHSFQDNSSFGDYGPTIILEHILEGVKFFTLYGHLNRQCLHSLSEGQEVESGREIALVGDMHENGQWPPHLHLEIISDLQGRKGDFPGVCALSEREKYLRLCPDPNLLLKIDAL